MEIPYTVYNTITGMIVKTGCCEEHRISHMKGPNEATLLGVYLPESYYVDPATGQPHAKEAMLDLKFELGFIQGIPYGSTLYIEELQQVIRADELASIKLEDDGEYTIHVSHPRFKTGIVRLTAG